MPVLRFAVAFGTLFGSACHVYVPVDPLAPAVGSSVRVLIQPDAAQRAALAVGSPVTQRVDGLFVGSRGDSVRVAVLIDRDSRYVRQDLRQEFSFSHSEVVQVQRPVFSKKRTAMLGVGVVGSLAYLISQYSSGTSGDPGGGDGSNPGAPAIRIRFNVSR